VKNNKNKEKISPVSYAGDGRIGCGWIGWCEWMWVMDASGGSPAPNPTRCQAYAGVKIAFNC